LKSVISCQYYSCENDMLPYKCCSIYTNCPKCVYMLYIKKQMNDIKITADHVKGKKGKDRQSV